MIPKIIHYCWFGGNPKPRLVEKCIHSWQKYCGEYEVIEWNEGNFDISSAPMYVQQAYEAKKWAFVSDYVRLYVVYNHGGVYLDTDVEILRNIDDLLIWKAFFGQEEKGYVNTGLGFGAIQYAPILKELMDDYQDILFWLENGEYDTTGCPVRNTKVLVQKGMLQENIVQMLEDGTKIFSEEYFCPKNYRTGEMNITENTYSIHHYDASWVSEKSKAEKRKYLKKKKKKENKKRIRAFLKKYFILVFGNKLFEKLRGQ